MKVASKVALATAAFAVVHSALASRTAKAVAAQKMPRGRERYRALYNAQALVTFGALTWYIARTPRRTLYSVHGPAAALMRLGQFSGVALAFIAARATGIATLAGVDAREHGTLSIRDAFVPAAQGPEADDRGRLRMDGPFRIVRHPLNLAPLAPFWLTPHLTTRRLAFNCVATLYLVAGSVHEEVRLRSAYGEAYAQYQRSGVPFFVPRLRRVVSPTAAPGSISDRMPDR